MMWPAWPHVGGKGFDKGQDTGSAAGIHNTSDMAELILGRGHAPRGKAGRKRACKI